MRCIPSGIERRGFCGLFGSHAAKPCEHDLLCASSVGTVGGVDKATSLLTPTGETTRMPKYLIQGSYTPEGAKGLARAGGSSRRTIVGDMITKAGGKMESFYYAFGDADVYVIIDLPDVASAVALSLAVNASGAVALKTIPLFSAEEMDEAGKKQVAYRPPGA